MSVLIITGSSYQEKRMFWKRHALFSIVRRSHKHSSPTVLRSWLYVHSHHKLTYGFPAFFLLTWKYGANIKILCNIYVGIHMHARYFAISLKNKRRKLCSQGWEYSSVSKVLPKYQELNMDSQHPRTKADLGSACLWPHYWWMGTEEFWTLTISQSSQSLKLGRLRVQPQTLTQTNERVAGERGRRQRMPTSGLHVRTHMRTPT